LNAALPFAARVPLPKIIFARSVGLRTPALAVPRAYLEWYEHYT
jgi:hypothetical protein